MRFQKDRRDIAHMTDDVAALINLDGLQRHRGCDGMAAIGEAMAQAHRCAGIPGRSSRSIPATTAPPKSAGKRWKAPWPATCCRARNRIWPQPNHSPVRPKPVITSSSIRRMLWRVQHGGDGIEIAFRRHDGAARAHHRLHDHGGNGVGPFVLDQGIEIGGQAGGEILLALARLGAAIIMRHVGMEREAQAAGRSCYGWWEAP